MFEFLLGGLVFSLALLFWGALQLIKTQKLKIIDLEARLKPYERPPRIKE